MMIAARQKLSVPATGPTVDVRQSSTPYVIARMRRAFKQSSSQYLPDATMSDARGGQKGLKVFFRKKLI